jgi:hypothetical protein
MHKTSGKSNFPLIPSSKRDTKPSKPAKGQDSPAFGSKSKSALSLTQSRNIGCKKNTVIAVEYGLNASAGSSKRAKGNVKQHGKSALRRTGTFVGDASHNARLQKAEQQDEEVPAFNMIAGRFECTGDSFWDTGTRVVEGYDTQTGRQVSIKFTSLTLWSVECSVYLALSGGPYAST